MEYSVQLNERITAAFRNISGGVYFQLPSRLNGLEIQDNPLSTDDYGQSPLNTPYWDKVTVRTDTDDPIEYSFPNDPVIDADLQKKFVETPVFGGGSIIETAGLKEIEFRIVGVLWENTNTFPEVQLQDLLEVFQEGITLDVVSSRYFLYYNISKLFIKRMRTYGLPGFPDSEYFVIQARSVKPVELEIFEP